MRFAIDKLNAYQISNVNDSPLLKIACLKSKGACRGAVFGESNDLGLSSSLAQKIYISALP
jgi:hypothetical protein